VVLQTPLQDRGWTVPFSGAGAVPRRMRIRGERECRDCGTRWAYYETGSIDCPACGSVRSRGLDEERVLHTRGAATLDLTPVRDAVDDRPLAAVADDAGRACRAYVRQDGFVDGGDLRPRPDGPHAARELVHAADIVGRATDVDEREELYLLALLRSADDGERPPPGEVPASLRAARGLAAAEGVRAYRGDVRAWLEDHPHPEAREPLGRLDQHAKRLEALQGDVPPSSAETLVAAARALGTYLRDDDEAALARAGEHLDALGSIRED
jgi:hypothetical protein